jgi:inward rectifier potassium channel
MRYRAKRLEAEDLDLGFGAVVADRSRRRLLNRDGSFNVVRRGLGWRGALSLYHSLLTLSWPRFLLLVLGGYLTANFVFAALYALCGPDALSGMPPATDSEQFLRAFFFSVHTLSTIGYGQIVPATLGANLLMTAESIAGLFGLALVTGLVFARFSRPTADIVFSRHAVVAPYRGLTAFQFRIANRRRNQLVELEAKVHFTRLEGEPGSRKRRFYDLDLERRKVTFFPLSWTLVHPIDDDSPLYGLGPEELAASEAEFLVMLTGIDETFSQTVHARSSYRSGEIVWQARFDKIYQSAGRRGALAIDLRRIHTLRPAE